MSEVTKYFEQAISRWLDKEKANDELFADQVKASGKTVEGCCNYIIQRVRESKQCGYSDDEIYGMARHFFDESSEKDPGKQDVQRIVVSVWHNASEEPNDMGHCLIFYGCKESVGHYLHYEPVIYNKKEKMFVTSSFPHPTGYKVEQKSFDGGCVAEVYKDRRNRISISDITQWCYLCDLHNLSNIERIGKEWKEEPVSEDLEEEELEEAAKKYAKESYPDELSTGQFGTGDYEPYVDMSWQRECAVEDFKAGAEWQKKQDQSTIELAEDHAMLAGMEKRKISYESK